MSGVEREAGAAGATPGPWRDVSEERGGIKAGGKFRWSSLVATSSGPLAIDCTQSGKTQAEDRANARLIAAAPTMYEYISERAKAGDASAISILEAIHGHS